jgi:uncharacterized SAM-binding protein YcdF (DUF218 family)
MNLGTTVPPPRDGGGAGRRLLWPLAAVVAVVALVTALSFPLFVWPAVDPPPRADAVVVFAGGDGERQQEGVRLVEAGVAPVLVISDGGRPGSPKYRVCREPQGLRVVCLSPRPRSTDGEARAFAALAERRGWRSLVLVTSTIHVRRASLLVGRCYDGRRFTDATPLHNDRRVEMLTQVVHEWLGLLGALTVRRGC